MLSITLSYPGSAEVPDASIPKVIAVGEFDGVHLGHTTVIHRAKEIAEKLGAVTALMTFDPHPKLVLGQEQYVQLLSPMDSKKQLFEQLGIELTYFVHFNDYLMAMSPQRFVEEVLIPLVLHTVVVGFDFRFGHQGLGHAEMLRELSKGRFHVEIVPPFHLNGLKVSSTAIREALQQGDVEAARMLLGRNYTVSGEVVRGDGRGRTIGFPTANILPQETSLIPAKGVYAIRASIAGREGVYYKGVMNIGLKPTFRDNLATPVLEAHLFNFNEAIYGSSMEVEFLHFIRSERKFASPSDLIEQIQRDVAVAKSI